MLRLAQHFENGAKKYGDRNWELGQPVSTYLDSAIRHLFRYLGGSRSEDHLAAVAWNALCCIETIHWIEEGLLLTSLNDIEFLNAKRKDKENEVEMKNLSEATVEEVEKAANMLVRAAYGGVTVLNDDFKQAYAWGAELLTGAISQKERKP